MNRQQKKQQTREKILTTAGELFSELGYEAVSTRLIAKKCEIGVGTVFSHFEDKRSLIKALFHLQLEQQLLKQFDVKNPTSGLEYFLQKSAHLYQFYAQDRAFSVVLLQNSLFDLEYFEAQMQDFILALADKLVEELPNHSQSARFIVAKAWFGYYFFNLINGISRIETKPHEWLDNLQSDCQQLLNAMA